MPNLSEFTRNKCLVQGADTLSQAQYEALVRPNVESQEIFAIHDDLFGGNLSKIPRNNLDTGPYLPPDEAPDLGYDDSEFVDSPEPVCQP